MKSTNLLARKSFLLGLVLALSFANDAMALCGDVTGDGEKTATDALAVLQSAVGIPTIELTCSGEGPTDMRFYNPFWCDTGSSLSTARFNGFTFANCDTDQYTAYQSIDRSSNDNIEIAICGSTYVFPGPINLPPGRKDPLLAAIHETCHPRIVQVVNTVKAAVNDGVQVNLAHLEKVRQFLEPHRIEAIFAPIAVQEGRHKLACQARRVGRTFKLKLSC